MSHRDDGRVHLRLLGRGGPAPGPEHDMEDHPIVVRVILVAMAAPVRGVHMELHVAGHQLPRLGDDNGVMEIWTCPVVGTPGGTRRESACRLPLSTRRLGCGLSATGRPGPASSGLAEGGLEASAFRAAEDITVSGLGDVTNLTAHLFEKPEDNTSWQGPFQSPLRRVLRQAQGERIILPPWCPSRSWCPSARGEPVEPRISRSRY